MMQGIFFQLYEVTHVLKIKTSNIWGLVPFKIVNRDFRVVSAKIVTGVETDNFLKILE